jgi:type I restriction enzyme S subunit
MMNFGAHPRYESYQDTGVQWLGTVPIDWAITRLGTVFTERRTKVSDKDYEPLSVTKNGILKQLDSAAKTNDGDNRKLVKKGDFVINSRSDRKGSSGVSPLDGSVSLINIVLQPKGIHPVFCNYVLKSYAFVEEYYRMGHGIVADLWTTRYDEMRGILMALPSPDEQRAIAAFLDDKCAKIDEAVKIKEDQIALLRERRQIIIQDAVTRGINPTAPMMDSGIDWIGTIPAHWAVKRLKHISTKVGSGITPSGGALSYVDKGVPLLRSQNVLFGKIDFLSAAMISHRVHQRMQNSQVRKGDVLLNITGGSIGRCHFVDTDDELNVNQHVCIIRPARNISTPFLNALLSSEIGQKQIWVFQQGGGREGLNFEAIKSFLLPLPPLKEQHRVIAHIERASRKIEDGIAIKERQIAALKEYKTSLINAAVTGKIKVV